MVWPIFSQLLTVAALKEAVALVPGRGREGAMAGLRPVDRRGRRSADQGVRPTEPRLRAEPRPSGSGAFSPVYYRVAA